MRVLRIADLALPRLVAIDGRSASGKSTLAAHIAAATPGAAVVHTDDVAWHHDFYDWADLLADGVRRRVRAGEAVSYRPPASDARPHGAVTEPAGAPPVLVEGVGVGRRSLAALFDALVWVETDPVLARVRGLARDGEDPGVGGVLGRVGRPRGAVPRPRTALGARRSGRSLRTINRLALPPKGGTTPEPALTVVPEPPAPTA